MRDEILVYLDCSNPRLALVRYPGFAADTHDHLVMMHTVDQISQRIWIDLGVGINLVTVNVNIGNHGGD